MARLEDSHKAQIAEMLKDEKPWGEIIDFMKKTYGINVKNHHIAYIKKTRDGVVGEPVKGKRHYHRRKGGIVKNPNDAFITKLAAEFTAPGANLSDDQLKSAIISGIREIPTFTRNMMLEIYAEIEKVKVSILKSMAIPKGMVFVPDKKSR